MMNMRRMMKSPVLRLRDGGSAFGDDATLAQPALKGRAADAIALSSALAYQPMMPSPQFQAPTRIPLALRDGGNYRKGSMDGGKVVGPGTGVSDSVPARYSNGEYVLPADTAAAIGHDQLDAIKDATHTPAAVQRGLRDGGNDGQENTQRYGSVPGSATGRQDASFRGGSEMDGQPGGPDGAGGMGSVRGLRSNQSLRLADGGIPGIDVTERPFTSADSRAFATDPGPGNPNVGKPPVAAVPPVSPIAEAAPAGRMASLRAGVNGFLGTGESAGAVGGAFKSVAAPIVNAGGAVLRAAGKVAAPLALGSATVQGLSTNTEDYAKRFGLENTEPGVLRDLGVRALGVASDVGNDATFGLAKKYLYRDGENGALAPKPSIAFAAPAANPVAAAASPAATLTPGDATMPGQDPGRGPLLRGMGGTDLKGAPGVVKFTQDGKTLYSNVSTPGDNDALMNGRAGVSTVPGMSRQAIDAALGGQSAGQTAADNQIRAANLRDGVDMERGTSLEASKNGNDLMARIARQGPNHAIASLLANQQNATTLRSQDITREDNIRTNNTSLTNNRATNALGVYNAQREQGNADRTNANGRDDAAFTQRETSRKALNDEIAGMLPATAEGKPDLDNAARYSMALNADVASKQAQLQQDVNSGKPGAAQALADLTKNGHGALGESYKRNFIAGMKAKDLADKNSTSRLNPMGGRSVVGDAPITSLRKTSDGFLGFGGEYTANNGATLPARVVEKDGSFIGGLRRNDLNSIITK